MGSPETQIICHDPSLPDPGIGFTVYSFLWGLGFLALGFRVSC